MPPSWNEIKTRAVAFSREWADETRETAEAKSFWDAFFIVFGLNRRAVATSEEPVRSIQGTYNRIDLFWKGRLLAEHKTAGRDPKKAKGQAFDYVQDLTREGRQSEVPQCIVVNDVARIQLYNLEAAVRLVSDFPLKKFHRHIKHFAFVAGYKQHTFAKEPAANIKATELIMPLSLTKAHAALDREVDRGHRSAPLDTERARLIFLFSLYQYRATLFPRAQNKQRRRYGQKTSST